MPSEFSRLQLEGEEFLLTSPFIELMVGPHVARDLHRCQPKNHQRACEQLSPVPAPPESLSSITQVAIAHPQGLCDP